MKEEKKKKEEHHKKTEDLHSLGSAEETAKEPAEEYKNRYLRALADLENYKKRTNLEKEEMAKYANESLVKELLPALDGFAKALEHADKMKDEEIVKGIALVQKLFEDALKKAGVEEISAVGKPYDPHMHEAIYMKESGQQPGIVMEEAQKGYTMRGRLIRPAMVIVSKKEEGK